MSTSLKVEQVWSDYSAGLKSFLHSRLSEPADVDDLLQDILIRVHKNLNVIKDQTSIKSWLYQIANNAIIDHYRKQAKFRGLRAEDLWYDETDAETRQSLALCVTPFINRLPKEMSEAMHAVEIRGLSQRTYASEQGILYSTLKSRVQTGRQKLRTMFEGCCHLSLDAQGGVMDYQAKSSTCQKC